jgi:hypothetical protein
MTAIMGFSMTTMMSRYDCHHRSQREGHEAREGGSAHFSDTRRVAALGALLFIRPRIHSNLLNYSKENQMGQRPLAKLQAAIKKANPPPPPAPFSCPEVATYYNEVMNGLPADSWALVSVKMIALQVAESQRQCDLLNAALAADGVRTDEGKAHPALAAVAKAQATMASLLARLKALPSGDAREMARAAKFEASLRRGVPTDADKLIAGYEDLIG